MVYDDTASELEAMMNETHVSEDIDTNTDNISDNVNDTDNTDVNTNENATNEEDTTLNQNVASNDDTTNQNADFDTDTSVDGNEEQEGNTLVEGDSDNSTSDDNDDNASSDNSDDNSDDTSSNDDNADNTIDAGDSNDSGSDNVSTDAEQTNVGEDGSSTDDTDGIDYKAFYEKVANSEFKANGKTVKGFSDPDMLIKAQQMYYGYESKMSVIKEARPLIGALKKNGMLEDRNKFNLMMDIANGDVEALKQHIKNLELDPVVDMDIEDINYKGRNHVTSDSEIVIEDSYSVARNLGPEVETKLKNIIEDKNSWDDKSFELFIKEPAVRSDLIDHINTGAYDVIQDRVGELKRVDVNGAYSALSDIERYRVAVTQLKAEHLEAEAKKVQISTHKNDTNVEKKEAKIYSKKVEAEKAKILKKREEAEYKAKAKKEEEKVAEARKKATAVSNSKQKSEEPAKVDPLSLTGDEFKDYFNSLL